MSGFTHVPVMLAQCMELLRVKPDGLYVDGTLGGGGHGEEILKRGARLIGIDRDEDAIRASSERLESYGDRFRAAFGNYGEIGKILSEHGFERADGVLLDLGVSSHQLDTPERGFSFHSEAPLDMRMDTSRGMTASTVLNTYPEEELRRIFYEYGEEKWSARIAKFTVEARPLKTTMDFVRVIDAAVPKAVRREVSHPARRCFQAVRIEVNGEISGLEPALDAAMDRLNPGGRLVVITFHSLEDRIVKNAFRRMENPCICPPGMPVCVCGKKPIAKVVTRKPVLPSDEENALNPRAHSAKLRAAERKE